MIKLSFFDSIKDPSVSLVREVTWNEIVKSFSIHKYTDKKKLDLPSFSPAIFKNNYRSNDNVEFITIGVLDLDDQSPAVLNALRFKFKKLDTVLHTTYSHNLSNIRIRVLIRLSRPVLINEWKGFIPLFHSIFNNVSDLKTQDPARLYFLPYAPVGSENHFTEITKGQALPVDKLLNGYQAKILPAQEDLPPLPLFIPTKQDLGTLSRKFLRRKDHNQQRVGHFLRAIKNGEIFTEEGHRDTVIFELIIPAIVKEWPNIHTEKAITLFSQSLNMTGGVDEDQFKYKIEREKKNREKFLATVKEKGTKQQLNRAQANLEFIDRENTYTKEELETWNDDYPLQYRKIIQHQNSFYFFVEDKYEGPFVSKAFFPAAKQKLAPFSDVQFRYVNADGIKCAFTQEDLIDMHGTLVNNIIYKLGDDTSHFDNKNRTLVLPKCPLIYYEPEYSEFIETWLKLLCGDQHERISRWLYFCTDLNIPLPAILFIGPKATGKTLFASLYSRFWDSSSVPQPLDMVNLFSTFCNIFPVVLADEEMPPVSPERIRQSIVQPSRQQEQKFVPKVTIEGHLRHIFAFNDPEKVISREIGRAAKAASADRFLYINVNPEAANYLQRTKEKYKNDPVMRNHLFGDAFPKHVRWIQENQNFKPDMDRFAVMPPLENPMYDSLIYNNPETQEILLILCNFILKEDPQHLRSKDGKWPIFVRDGKLFVSSTKMTEKWTQLRTSHLRFFDFPTIDKVIRTLAYDEKETESGYWRIDTSYLVKWAEQKRSSSKEQIEIALTINTDDKVGEMYKGG